MSNRAVIYIFDAKIQKQRLKDMKISAKKKKINVQDTLSDEVTHIVTEFKDRATVLQKLGLDNTGADGLIVLSLQWFTDCLRAGHLVEVQNSHRITSTQDSKPTVQPVHEAVMPDYACQRKTPLQHHNERFTTALEVLEKYAQLRDSDQDYSRALAFRRASCVLKSLPQALTHMNQLRNITHVGAHSKRVIQEILEDGHSEEVAAILRDPWFKHMKLFTGVFGIGPSKAKQFIANGWTSIKEVQDNYTTADWRVQYGLAFYEDLNLPVTRAEADYISSTVGHHLNTILPGAIMKNTGGFSRGKSNGHDVDILISHPIEQKVNGMLPRLLHSLQSHDLLVCGKLEKSSYRDEILSQNTKLTPRGQLDHFEKWIGIMKVPNKVREEQTGPNSHCEVTTLETIPGKSQKKGETKEERSEFYKQPYKEVIKGNSKIDKGEAVIESTKCDNDLSQGLEKVEQTKSNETEHSNKDTCIDSASGQAETNLCHQVASVNESLDIGAISDAMSDENPSTIARGPRDWTARRVDLIVSPYSQYFYALVGWVGSKQFNRDIRTYSEREMNMKLSSHGLYDLTKGRKLPARSEQEVFENLQLPYIPHEDRNC